MIDLFRDRDRELGLEQRATADVPAMSSPLSPLMGAEGLMASHARFARKAGLINPGDANAGSCRQCSVTVTANDQPSSLMSQDDGECLRGMRFFATLDALVGGRSPHVSSMATYCPGPGPGVVTSSIQMGAPAPRSLRPSSRRVF